MTSIVEAIGVVVVQVYWFTISTTGLLVQRKGRDVCRHLQKSWRRHSTCHREFRH
jgi:hypothetical protein